MFTNPYREKCVNILEKLLPRRAVQDSTLLQAYATFHMMKEVTLSGANYAEIYRAASRKSAPYLYALLADFAALKMPFPEDFVLMFDVQLDYFLRCVTPSLVADLRSFHRFFEEYGAPNLAAKVHYLVVLKLTSFKILEADEARAREKARTRSAKSEQEIPSSSGELFRGDLTDDALDRLYQVYCNIETNVAIRLNKEKFSALYRAINLYPLDNSELKIYAPNSKNVMELLNILSEKLEEPRSRQLSFAADFYVRNLQEGALFATYGMPLFSRNRDERERKKLLRKAEKRLSFSRGKWQAPDWLKFHILFLLAAGRLAFLCLFLPDTLLPAFDRLLDGRFLSRLCGLAVLLGWQNLIEPVAHIPQNLYILLYGSQRFRLGSDIL